jgi:hypothetical protein
MYYCSNPPSRDIRAETHRLRRSREVFSSLPLSGSSESSSGREKKSVFHAHCARDAEAQIRGDQDKHIREDWWAKIFFPRIATPVECLSG